MDQKSLKRTLLIYLVMAFLASSILAAISLIMEYTPSVKQSMQKFGIGAIFLNSVLWSLLFSLIGATSLLNNYESIRTSFLLSLLSFVAAPLTALIMLLSSVAVPGDFFGLLEAAIASLMAQLFFFFRFQSCFKKTSPMVIE